MNYLFFVVVLFISACSAGPQLKVGNALVMAGHVPSDMSKSHLVATVGFDEDYAGRYNRITNNFMYGTGVELGNPEYQLRVVRLNTAELTGLLWYGPGEFLFSSGGVVPDSMPRLMAGDIVEYRQTELRTDSLKNFSKTGEGPIVVKILCQKAQTDYVACVDKLPTTAKSKATGKTGRPYPVSVKEYGFSFTPMYDAKGNPLRPFP